MKKKIFLIGLTVSLSLLAGGQALAHQPRIVSGEEAVEIRNPEVSQAFYGELSGAPARFTVGSAEPFNLYVNILVPDLPQIDKDLVVEVARDLPEVAGEEEVFILNGGEYEWEKFYEEFGGDNYWRGPEGEKQVPAGIYKIKVTSPDNFGKYVLVLGRAEAWPLSEILNTIKTLPILKKNFFGKPPLTAFYNYVGAFFLAFIVAVFALGFLVFFVIKKLRNKRKEIKK